MSSGFVNDEETGLYYLRSRFYSPNAIRFWSPDTIYSGNLFSYCHNSPLIRIDPSGRLAQFLDSLSQHIERFLTSSEEEIIFCRSFGLFEGAGYAFIAHAASEAASYYTDVYFGANATNADATRANAFKHAYWNAYMTILLGYDVAKGIADAHEAPFVTDSTLHVGIPNYEHCEMDFYNNECGRQYGLKVADQVYSSEALALVIYDYAMSDKAYYRKESDGTIRSVHESRPMTYEYVMSLTK